MAKKKWSALGPRTRKAIVALGVVEVVMLVATQIDIARRPAELVRGPKNLWRALAFVNIVGPVAYFVRGRRTAH
ncbi:hypothetical protein FK531_06155 [Rhodococcus spelaei]|uniref:Cardiolipin synthase N-terminal domain-containing protein n=1 Tax=Rhodococcus spelaei TaxID=2546320 RepID=A0A541BPH6_9NOCA|nr:hypothetical protein [Rhodococcus spelaei]TQF74223.1 hypothetical protein FK531_06155 [Rhodococcus spelaei]